MNRECTKCGQLKPVEEFHKKAQASSGFNPQCADCKQQYEKERYALNSKDQKRKDQVRAYSLRTKYGITIEQYNQLLEKQNHCCALCEKHESAFKNRLAVDHNHETQEVRGLLCFSCNHRLVGRHKDGKLLRKIADYVEQGTGWFAPKQKRPKKRRPRRN